MANYDARLADFVARGGQGLPPQRAALRFGVSERTIWRWRRTLRDDEDVAA
jgi:hypothetical protein